MHRKKPFSGKQKKQQLKERRARKKDGPAYLAEESDEGNDSTKSPEAQATADSTHDAAGNLKEMQVQKLNQQPGRGDGAKLDANSFRLHFFKESDEVIKRHQKEARKTIRPVDVKHLEYKIEDVYPSGAKLDFPKRPPWNYSLTKEQLDHQENQYFKQYVSDILDQPRVQDLSYFELNLETWRQLWRVLEISDILLIIADIRYPVLHIPPSLISHVLNELHKSVIIILNKVDFVPAVQALSWKQYLQSVFPGIHIMFFTSFPRQSPVEDNPLNFDPTAAIYKRPFQTHAVPLGQTQLLQVCKEIVQSKVDLSSWERKIANETSSNLQDESDESESTASQLQSTSNKKDDQSDGVPESYDYSTQPSYVRYKDGIVTIGCIGYPNVGKSSVLNALVGRKVVSVSKTPGHTKHLQTIFLSPTVKLCDCPGLVFPSMVSKSLQVVAGIFPVAQVREPYSVVGYLAKRLDLPKLLKLTPPRAGKDGKDLSNYLWSAFDICEAWAMKNGFTTSKAGRPDIFRAANKILRLAVEGQLCLCFRPPNYAEKLDALMSDPETSELEDLLHRQYQRHPKSSYQAEVTEEEEEEDEEEDSDIDDPGSEEQESENEEMSKEEKYAFSKMQELDMSGEVEDDDEPT